MSVRILKFESEASAKAIRCNSGFSWCFIASFYLTIVSVVAL